MDRTPPTRVLGCSAGSKYFFHGFLLRRLLHSSLRHKSVLSDSRCDAISLFPVLTMFSKDFQAVLNSSREDLELVRHNAPKVSLLRREAEPAVTRVCILLKDNGPYLEKALNRSRHTSENHGKGHSKLKLFCTVARCSQMWKGRLRRETGGPNNSTRHGSVTFETVGFG